MARVLIVSGIAVGLLMIYAQLYCGFTGKCF